MSDTTHDDFAISAALARERQRALELVLGEVPAARRTAHVAQLIEAERGGQIDLAGLLVARQRGELVGAVWGQSQPGRTASVWPPAVVDNRANCQDALLRALTAWLMQRDVCVAQTLLTGESAEQAALLAQHGFVHLADLLYMVCLSAHFPNSPPKSALTFAPAPRSDDSCLAAIIERTYEGTLDCPQLNGVRDVHDVLAGYRACGKFDPARWLIARHGDQDVGCLLLTDHPDEDQWELVYAGLVPAERGHGAGLALAQHAQFLTRQAGRARLVLAVDAANVPAVTTYERVGFVTWDRRRAYLRVFPRGG